MKRMTMVANSCRAVHFVPCRALLGLRSLRLRLEERLRLSKAESELSLCVLGLAKRPKVERSLSIFDILLQLLG